jgi:hypothetical protein
MIATAGGSAHPVRYPKRPAHVKNARRYLKWRKRFMNKTYVPLAGLLAAVFGLAVFAQSPPPSAQPSDPSAASSPSQRAAVKSPADESPGTDKGASDSATPHQKAVMKKKHKKKAAPPPSN